MIGSTDLHHHFHRSCSKFPPLKAEHKPTFFAYNMDLNLIGSMCKGICRNNSWGGGVDGEQGVVIPNLSCFLVLASYS